MTASNTNPFLQVFPRTPLRRNFPTVSDMDTYTGSGRSARDDDGRPALQ